MDNDDLPTVPSTPIQGKPHIFDLDSRVAANVDITEEYSKLTEAEKEAAFLENMDRVSPEDYVALYQLMIWIGERPKDAEPLTRKYMDQLLDEIKLENTRRRLGGVVGKILPFAKPT